MKNKSHSMRVLWKFVTLVGLITSVKLEDCPEDKQTNSTYLCNEKITVELSSNQLIISCNGYNKSDYSKLIRNVSVGEKAKSIEEVEIRQCPKLQNDSYFEIFNTFKTKPIKKFTLSIIGYNESNTLTLEPSDFANLRSITDLRILNSSIEVLPQHLFVNMANLKDLYLNNNTLQNLTGKIFAPLKQLKYLNLNNNTLTNLNEDIFEPLSNLTVLKISKNKFKNLTSKIFNPLNELTDLDLGENLITTLNNDVFGSLKNLENLTLNDNILTRVPRKLFINNVNLKNLYIRNVFKRQNFSLPSEFLINLKSLRILNLGKNNLRLLPKVLFDNTTDLQELYLDGNYLSQSLDPFERLNKLTILDLSSNKFENIKTQDFINFNMSTNRTINVNLSYNQIKNIDRHLIELHNYRNDSARIVVKIEGNPIECDCEALHLAQYFRDNSTSNKSIDILPDGVFCHTPNILSNTSLKEVDLKQLKCSIKENCPSSTKQNCSCNYRSVAATVEVNCTSTGISVFPQQLPIYKNSNIPYDNLYYELFFANNTITSVLELSNLSKHFRITELHLSSNQLRNIDDIPRIEALKVLELHNNHLTNLNNKTINLLKSLVNLTTITLHENQWVCDCNEKYLLKFIQKSGKVKIPEKQNIKCKENGVSVTNLMVDQLCNTSSPGTKSSFYLISFLVLLVLFGAAVILYYTYKIRVWIWRNPRLRRLFWKKKVYYKLSHNAYFDISQENLNFIGSEQERVRLLEMQSY